jgi:two-component system, OmpR family, response regulator
MAATRRIRSLAFVTAAPLPDRWRGDTNPLAQQVHVHVDADALLISGKAYEHQLYIVGGDLGGRDGIALIHLLRRRTQAAVLVWRGRAPCAAWLDAGADLWLPKAATEVDLEAAVRAIARRIDSAFAPQPSAPIGKAAWRLDRQRERLRAPSGTSIALSQTDVRVLACFIGTDGLTVSHETLHRQLGHQGADADNWLHATIYRLRRRIERAAEDAMPLEAEARIGYAFKAPLIEA